MIREIEICHNLCRESKICIQDGTVRHILPLSFGNPRKTELSSIEECLIFEKEIKADLVDGEWIKIIGCPSSKPTLTDLKLF